MPRAPAAAAEVRQLKDVVRDATRQAILDALAATGGSRTNAAQVLGVSRKTLFNKMREVGIQEETSWS
jgi:DNA-binding NtrC family response regulator